MVIKTCINDHVTLKPIGRYFFTENKSSILEFKTRSGVLKARKENDGSITLDFPSNPPSRLNNINAALIKVIIGDLDVFEIQYSSVTKKLLIRLADHYNR